MTDETMKDGERSVCCPECGGGPVTWKCTCEPMWRPARAASPQSGDRAARVADALEGCDWSGAPIGNKAIIAKAVALLRAASPQSGEKGDSAINQARHEAYAEGYADGKEYACAAAPQPFVIEENERDGNWREFSVNGHGGFIRVVARMEGDNVDLPLGKQVAQWLLSGGPRGTELPHINIRCETVSQGVTGGASLNVVRVEMEDDGSYTAVTDHWPHCAEETRAALTDARELLAKFLDFADSDYVPNALFDRARALLTQAPTERMSEAARNAARKAEVEDGEGES